MDGKILPDLNKVKGPACISSRYFGLFVQLYILFTFGDVSKNASFRDLSRIINLVKRIYSMIDDYCILIFSQRLFI